MSGEVTLTTFNIHWGGRAPGGRDTFDLAAASARLPGTVRVFQEVWDHPDEPVPLSLPDGWEVIEHEFTQVRRPHRHRLPEPQRSREGTWSIVVATCHPVLDRWSIDLPRIGRDARRHALGLRLDTPAGELAVVAVHLASTLIPAGPVAQVLALRRRLPEGPLVVLGDHNLWAGATRRLYRDLTLAAKGPTWEAPKPRHQIDHIWVRGLDVVRGEVLPAMGSDHLPVTATVRSRAA